jgi:UDP-2,3-diacylglucosamine hydrolase
MSDLVFVGDVHLDAGDPDLPAFLEFLAALGDTAGHVVLVGDLFNLWIGRPELEQPHHTAVLQVLRGLRQRGVRVDYLEGNRDYRIGPAYSGTVFDQVAERELVAQFGGRRVVAIHGDLANLRDRQYRAWRRLSRSAPVWALFNVLPRAMRQRYALNLERRMRGTNRAFKREVDDAMLRGYAASLVRGPEDLVVLGHFHVERDLPLSPKGSGRVLVVPEWKGTRRHLRLSPAGDVRFAS